MGIGTLLVGLNRIDQMQYCIPCQTVVVEHFADVTLPQHASNARQCRQCTLYCNVNVSEVELVH